MSTLSRILSGKQRKSSKRGSKRRNGRSRTDEAAQEEKAQSSQAGIAHVATPAREELAPFSEEEVKKDADVPLPDRELKMGEHLFLELPHRYEYTQYLGHGAFGEVCEALDTETGTKVAIKKQKGFFGHRKDAKLLLRELRILRLLRDHPNIVRLYDIICPEDMETFDRLFVVFEYVDTDLRKLLDSHQDFSDLHVQYMLYQILLGVKYMHSASIIHRDLKPANILVNANCSLKICDFGLARGIEELNERESTLPPSDESGNGTESHEDPRKEATKKHALTRHVVTRWYRCPEVLLLEQTPGDVLKAIDMWSVGCILADLFKMISGNHDKRVSTKRRPLFPGGQSYLTNKDPFTWQNSKDQLNVIFKVMGTPSATEIEAIRDEHARQFLRSLAHIPRQPLNAMFPSCSPLAIDLLVKLLAFLPQDRMTVDEALSHPYLSEIRCVENELETDLATFEFEERRVAIPELREKIVEEILAIQPNQALSHHQSHGNPSHV